MKIRAEQVQSLTLKDLQIADDAAIQQHKIEDWESDASGWISKGIIKPVTTAELPVWDGSQAGQFYYDINTNEIFIGISTPPYYSLIAGDGGSSTGDTVLKDRLIVVKSGYEAENWSGVDENDLNGTSSIFSLDTDKVSANGSNLMVYLNGVLQERGSGNDYLLYEEDGLDKIQFTYNLEGPDQKISAIVSIDEYLVNYATKAFVEGILMDTTAHDHNGSGSPRLDFNEAITAASLAAITNPIIPETNAVDLGSPTNKFGKIYAEEGHFNANTIYLGNVALSGNNDKLLMSKDDGSTYHEIAISGSEIEPAQLAAGAGQKVILESTAGIVAKGDIIPDMTGAVGEVSLRNIGSATEKFNSIYADEVFVGASSLYVNGKKVISDVSDEMIFATSHDQAMKLQTSASTPGSGNANITIQAGNEFNVIAAGGMEWAVGAGVSTKHMNFLNQSSGGNLTFTTSGVNSQIQFNATDEIDLTATIIDVNGDLDVSGQITGNVTGNLTGNADTASKWATARTITLAGDATGSVSIDGSENKTLTVDVNNDSHTHSETAPYLSHGLYTAGGSSVWVTIADTNGGNHGLATFHIYGYSPGKHSATTYRVGFHHGQATITQLYGDTYASSEIHQARVLYLDSDRTYGGGRFQVLVSASSTIYFSMEEISKANRFPGWRLITPTTSNSGWSDAKTYPGAAGYGMGTTSSAYIGWSLFGSGHNDTEINGFARVYNAVGNDIADFIEVEDECEIEYGKCYCIDKDGKHKKTETFAQRGTLGIASDTCGYGLGKAEAKHQLPVAIGGFVLAYIIGNDFMPGDALTSGSDGQLVFMPDEEAARLPHRIVATYYKPEPKEEYNGIKVDGRHWVKVN